MIRYGSRCLGKVFGMTTPWYIKARTIRKAKNITYQQIADELGVTEGAVGHWMTGKRSPDLKTIKGIAVMLDTSLSELLEDDPYYLQSQNERDIVDLYRQLPESQHETIARIIKSLIPESKE